MKKQNDRTIRIVMIVLALFALVLGIIQFRPRPYVEEYRFKTPPPGPNARPDPPNPDKIRRLPGSFSPAGAGSSGATSPEGQATSTAPPAAQVP